MRTSSDQQWPVAAVTVQFELDDNRPPTALQLLDIVQLAVLEGGDKVSLVFQDRFDDGDAVMLGQQSGHAERQFIVTPLPSDDTRPFFMLNRSYSGLRVVSHSWGGERYMNAYTDADVIANAQGFAKRIEHVVAASYPGQMHHFGRFGTGPIPPWETLSFLMSLPAKARNNTFKRTPAEWDAILDPTTSIADPDGWRSPYAKSYDEPLTQAEFMWRETLCTIKGQQRPAPVV